MKQRMVLESKVKQLATEQSLGAYDLAILARTNPQTVYGVWTGDISNRSARTLAIVARALKVLPHELYNLVEVMN